MDGTWIWLVLLGLIQYKTLLLTIVLLFMMICTMLSLILIILVSLKTSLSLYLKKKNLENYENGDGRQNENVKLLTLLLNDYFK